MGRGEKKMKKMTLLDVVRNTPSLDEYLAIYIPKDSDCELGDKCLLLDYSDENDTLYPSYKYLWFINTLAYILDNLSQQKSNYTDEDVIRAIKYYYENDAFIEL